VCVYIFSSRLIYVAIRIDIIIQYKFMTLNEVVLQA